MAMEIHNTARRKPFPTIATTIILDVMGVRFVVETGWNLARMSLFHIRLLARSFFDPGIYDVIDVGALGLFFCFHILDEPKPPPTYEELETYEKGETRSI